MLQLMAVRTRTRRRRRSSAASSDGLQARRQGGNGSHPHARQRLLQRRQGWAVCMCVCAGGERRQAAGERSAVLRRRRTPAPRAAPWQQDPTAGGQAGVPGSTPRTCLPPAGDALYAFELNLALQKLCMDRLKSVWEAAEKSNDVQVLCSSARLRCRLRRGCQMPVLCLRAFAVRGAASAAHAGPACLLTAHPSLLLSRSCSRSLPLSPSFHPNRPRTFWRLK